LSRNIEVGVAEPLLDQREWSLHKDVMNQIFLRFGFPVLDLFASRNNYKLQRWFSLARDPLAEAWNAFSQTWVLYGYAFPPHAILRRVIEKVKSDKATLILIAPYWPQSPWMSDLLMLLIDLPLLLPNRQDLLQQQGIFHRDPKFWKLAAWKISGDTTKTEDFRRRLLTLSRPPEGRVQGERTTPSGRFLFAGVVQGVKIHFQLM
jgi:hypothetical protein